MSILKKYDEVFMNKDEAGMNEVLHDDYKFTMHASGKVLTKQDVIPVSYTHLTLPTKRIV